MNLKPIMLFLSIFIIIFATNTIAIEVGDTISNNITGYSIKYYNGNVYVEQIGIGSANSTINNATLFKYNTVSNQYSRHDSLASGGVMSAPAYTPDYFIEGNAGTYGAYYDKYFVINGKEYFIGITEGSAKFGFKVYYKNLTSSNWSVLTSPFLGSNGGYSWYGGISTIGDLSILTSTTYQGGAGGCASGGITCGYIFNFTGTENMTVLNNYKLSNVGTPPFNSIRTVATPKNSLQAYSVVGDNKYVYNTLTSINSYAVSYPLAGFFNQLYMDTWYSTDDAVFYTVQRGYVIRSSVDLSNLHLVAIDLASYTSCSDLLGNVTLTSIDCINATSCLIGGSYRYPLVNPVGDFGLLVYTDGSSCTRVFSGVSEAFTPIDINNTRIYSITNDGTRFYYVGKNIFGSYQFGNESNATANIPICINNDYKCTNPIWNVGEWGCAETDIAYCNEGCINFITDLTTDTNYQSTFNNCNTVYQSQSVKSWNCGSIPNNFWGLFDYWTYGCSIESNTFSTPSATCTNSNVNEIVNANPTHQFLAYGVCSEDGSCTNECNIIGQPTCDSTTSFKVCGNYDDDPCLEYGNSNGCTSGNICGITQCITNTGIGLGNNSAFTVTPYSISSNDVVYSNDVANKKLTVQTKTPYHIQDFSINTLQSPSYSSRTCNYLETSIYNNVQNVPITNDTTINFNTLGTTGFVQVGVEPSDNVTTIVEFRDSTTTTSSLFILERDSDLKKLCITRNNETNATYCDFSINSYDDLVQVIIRNDYNFQAGTYTTTFTFDRLQDNTVSTQPQLINTLDIASIKITSNSSIYKSTQVSSYPQTIPFSLTNRGDYSYLRCTYNSQGCRVARTYNNNNALSDTTNYYDYTVCVSQLSASSLTTPNAVNNLPSLSGGAKILIILIIVFITIIGFSVGGYGIGQPKVGMSVGIVLAIFEMIVATIPDVPLIGGFLPVWVTILIGVITVLVASFLLVRLQNNSSGGSGI